MAKFTYTQHSFDNGMLNPRMLGRTDIKEYFRSGKTVDNFVIANNGGLNEVQGSIFLANTTKLFSEVGLKGKFTWKEKYVFYDYDKIGEVVQASGTQALRIVEKVYVPDLLPSNVALFEYGTHLSINDVLIVTDKNGVVEPLVYYTELDSDKVSAFYHWASKVNNTAFTSLNARIRSYAYTAYNSYEARKFNYTAGTVTSPYSLFTSDYIGKFIIFKKTPTEDVVFRIDTVLNVFQVTGAIVVGALPDADYTFYRLPLWLSNSAPKVVSLFANRLIFANSRLAPDVLWNSIDNNLGQFSKLAQDTDQGDAEAFDLQPASVDSSPILWVVPERYVTMGTASEEYIVSMNEGRYSNATASIRSVSKYGSRGIGLALRVQNSTIFVERDGTTIREMKYSEENGGYVALNLSMINPDTGYIEKMIYDYPKKRIYLTANNQVWAFSIDQTVGVLGATKVGYIPVACGILELNGENLVTDGEEALLIYQEGLSLSYDYSMGVGLVDVSISPTYVTGGGDTDIKLPNLFTTPLSGETVEAKINGAWVSFPVSSASSHPDALNFPNGTLYLTIPSGVTVPYLIRTGGRTPSLIETTPIQQGSQVGDAQIHFQRVDKVAVRVYNTKQGFKVGTKESSMETVKVNGTYSGLVNCNPAGIPEQDHIIRISNESENPIVILSVATRGQGSEG